VVFGVGFLEIQRVQAGDVLDVVVGLDRAKQVKCCSAGCRGATSHATSLGGDYAAY